MFSKPFFNYLLCLSVLTIVGISLVLSATSDDKKCTKPAGRTCTALTPQKMKDKGFGAYFKYPCIGIGCNFYRPYCRLCAKNSTQAGKPYVQCPSCVADVEKTLNQTNDGFECFMPRSRSCTSLTPSMTKAVGLGLYYQYPCNGAGCNFIQPYCRLCVTDRLRNSAPYPKCPECIT